MQTITTTNGHANGKAYIVGDRHRKPSAHSVIDDAIPEAVKLLDRSLAWNWVWKPKANGGLGKWTKPPMNARTGDSGSCTNSATWSRFDEALKAQRAGRFDGVGFALGDADGGLHFAGIDLDDCRDVATGEIADWAMAIVRLLDSYTEISPSGTGLHILILGKLPPGARQVGNIECYDTGRYFTITGHVLDDGPRKLRDTSIEIEQFFEAYMVPAVENTSGLSDPELAASALKGIDASRADDYWQWIQVGMALKSVDDGLLVDWEQWSAGSSKFSDGECATKWKSFQRGGVGLGSLIFWARQNGWIPPARAKQSFKLTDLGNAERFTQQHGADVRYCHEQRLWYVYDGRRWAMDASGEVERKAKRTVRSIYMEAAAAIESDSAKAISKWAAASERRERISATIGLAESEQPIPISVGSLDSAPYLLNCLNGTLDLKTGELREHRREDYLTKCCPVDYPIEGGDDPELWLSTVDRIFAGKSKQIKYLQRLFGVSLVGEVLEHVLPIFFGGGSNGKTLVLETWAGMLGDYAGRAPHSLLISTRSARHPCEIADLHGKRLVAGEESAEGGCLSEALVKELTGGSTINARRMRENFWTFKPSHTLVLATNHKPTIRGADHGIWRRIHLVPFTVTIPPDEQDQHLARKLQAEWPAILRWAVAGCLDWQRNGLQAPQDVVAATDDYRADMDVLGKFVEERCVVREGCTARASLLYEAYKRWAIECGEFVETQTHFGTHLKERGFTKGRDPSNRVTYVGLGLIPEGPDSSEGFALSKPHE